MNPVLKSVIIIGCLILPGTSVDAQWHPLGPGGGSINAFAAAGEKVYAATDVGVYETLDDGDHWSLIGLDTLSVVALHTKGNLLFAACSNGKIYSTSNDGRAWECADSGLPATPQTCFASIGTVIFACRYIAVYPTYLNKGVFRSADDGKSWVQIGLRTFYLYDGVSLASEGDTLYAFGSREGRLFKSGDMGDTWEWFPLNTAILDDRLPPLAVSNSILYAAASAGIQQSSDHGKTWSLSYYYPHSIISIAAHDGTIMFGDDDGGGLFRSIDSGKTWQNDPLFGESQAQAISYVDSRWFIGTKTMGAYRSNDSGFHWEMVNHGFANAIVKSLLLHKGELFAVTNIGLFSSTDQGRTWKEINLDFALLSLASVNGDLLAGAVDGIHISHDAGEHWSLLNSAMTVATAIAQGAGIVYACGSGRDIYSSRDSGRTWNLVLGNRSGWINSLSVSDSLIYLPWQGFFWDHYYGKIYFSIDGGVHWNSSLIDGDTPPVAVGITSLGIFAGVDVNFYSYKQSGIVRSLDSGKTWNYVNSTGPALYARFFFETGNAIYLGTSNNGLMRIVDNGSQIVPVFPTIQHGLTNVSSAASSLEYLFVGTAGAGVWRVPLTLLGVEEWASRDPLQPSQFSLDQNYPNPFNPSTTISFSIPSRMHVSLKIYDVLGREVASIVSEDLPAGRYSRQWNPSDRPSGMYFYRLQAGAYAETKCLVRIK